MHQKFALIGCGKIAERHAENIITKGTLQAVCDIIPDRASELAKKFNATPYQSLASLLQNEKGLTVACICTPNGLHALHTIKCLQAGLHVLCEKPLCIKSEDGKAMIEAARLSGKKLFVVKSTRFNPVVAQLKKIIDEDRLGKIYSFQLSCFWNRPAAYYQDSWKGTLKLDGGTLYTQFSHYIDVMYWLFGEVKNVQGIRKNMAHEGLIEFEDCGVISIEMKNRIVGTLNYSVNTFKKNMELSLTVIAEKGTVKIGGQYLNELKYQLIDDYIFDNPGTGNTANDYTFYKGSMSNHDKVYDNLLLALNEHEHLSATADEGLKTITIIEKIYEECKLI
ncbi:MAG: Gfo/Idh/MocA family oxidoreductase [Ginsengibacter sp.]